MSANQTSDNQAQPVGPGSVPNELVSQTASSPEPNWALPLKERFEKTIKRVEHLLASVDKVESNARSDILRAGVVLAVAALDAFVTQIMHKGVGRLLKDKSRPIPTKLQEKLNDLKPAELIKTIRGDVDEKLLKEKVFGQFTSQGTRRITQSMEFLGHKNILSDVAKLADKNMDNLQRDLDRVTGRRHDIVHRGDYNNSTPPSEQNIEAKFVELAVSTARLVANNIFELVSK